MGEFNLIKIEGQALEKLFDVISKAIGKIYAPRAVRKEADAKAYEIGVIEKAKTNANIYRQEAKQDMLYRIEERIIHRELKKQENIDAVVEIAAEQLKNEKNISDTPIDEDWTVRFFNIVEDVSDEQMQQLWGKILAGEVKNPNSFSIHTIEFLKNMTKSEAELFSRIANYIILSNNKPFIFNGDKTLSKNGFSFEECLILAELGLIQADTNLMKEYKTYPEDRNAMFLSDKYIIKATIKGNTPQCQIPVLVLTRIGEELLKLLSPIPLDNYIKDFLTYLQNHGFTVEYAFVLKIDGDIVSHTQPWMKL
jgi:hypothetical protein